MQISGFQPTLLQSQRPSRIPCHHVLDGYLHPHEAAHLLGIADIATCPMTMERTASSRQSLWSGAQLVEAVSLATGQFNHIDPLREWRGGRSGLDARHCGLRPHKEHAASLPRGLSMSVLSVSAINTKSAPGHLLVRDPKIALFTATLCLQSADARIEHSFSFTVLLPLLALPPCALQQTGLPLETHGLTD